MTGPFFGFMLTRYGPIANVLTEPAARRFDAASRTQLDGMH